MAKGGRPLTGKVKYWLEGKGWGFIIANDGPNGEPMTEVFVHYKEILGEGRKNLTKDQLVEFNVRQTARGPKASDVRPASNGL